MASNYCTVDDIAALWRPLTAEEQTRAEALIPVVSAELRVEASKVGKILDVLVNADEDYAQTVKSVTVDIIARTMRQSTDSEPMSQFSQSALGYTVSGTYLNPYGGIYISKNDLRRLGLRRQRYGVIDFTYDDD